MGGIPHGRTFDEVGPLGEPFALAGAPDVAVVLDVFTPTHLDAWRARVVLPAGLATGSPSAPPQLVGGLVHATAVVVRHRGPVSMSRPRLGRRRHSLDALLRAAPPLTPLLGIVLEDGTATLRWEPGAATTVAARLSRPDWRSAPVDPEGPRSVP